MKLFVNFRLKVLPGADLRARSVCTASGGVKRQNVVVIPELAGKKCCLFHQRPVEGHVFLLSVT
jgi:hypothetical protein